MIFLGAALVGLCAGWSAVSQEVHRASAGHLIDVDDSQPNGGYLYQRYLARTLIDKAATVSTLADFEAWTRLGLKAIPGMTDVKDDGLGLTTAFETDDKSLYHANFYVRGGVPDKDATTEASSRNGYIFAIFIMPQYPDVERCLSLADVRYYAERAGYGDFEADLSEGFHGFHAEKRGMRLYVMAHSELAMKTKDHPSEQGRHPQTYTADYLNKVYAFEGCVEDFQIDGFTQGD